MSNNEMFHVVESLQAVNEFAKEQIVLNHKLTGACAAYQIVLHNLVKILNAEQQNFLFEQIKAEIDNFQLPPDANESLHDVLNSIMASTHSS